MKLMNIFCYVTVLFLTLGCGSSYNDSAVHLVESPSNHSSDEIKSGYYKVTKVIDGDTFWVTDSKKKFKVRFIGIDAPETRNSRWKKKGLLAAEAKRFVQDLTEGKSVRLELDIQLKDRYERVLAYIYLTDGRFLNAELLKMGYAVVDTYPPNVKYVDLFVALQQEAKKSKVGLWSTYGTALEPSGP